MREITALMLVKLFSMLCLEVLAIQENDIFPSPFFKYFQFGVSTGLGREGTTCLSTNSKSEVALSGCFSVSFCQFCAP